MEDEIEALKKVGLVLETDKLQDNFGALPQITAENYD